MLDARQVVAGSALLLGEGLIQLDSVARETGIPVDNLVQEARNWAIELRVYAAGWDGTDMPASELEYDHDGSLILNCIRDFPVGVDRRRAVSAGRQLRCGRDGMLEACLFFRDRPRQQAVVFQLPGVSVPLGDLLLAKADAEAIRQALAASVTPAMLEAASARVAATTATGHKYATMKASDLVRRFLEVKGEHWSEATKIEMASKLRAFMELMADPVLGDIDGALVLDYRDRLLIVPANVHLAKRKLKVSSFVELVERAGPLPTTKPERAAAYVTRLSELFGWALKRGFIPANPAAGAVTRTRKVRRAQG